MTDAGAAVGMDRLPWLDDEPAPAPRVERTPREARPARPTSATQRSGREIAGWAAALILLVGGGSYWLGTRSGQAPIQLSPPVEQPMATPLPGAREAPAPQVVIPQSPEIRPVPAPTVAIPRPVRRDRAISPERRRKLSPMEMEGSDLSKTVAEQEGKAPAPEKAESSTAQAPAAAPEPPRVAPAPSRAAPMRPAAPARARPQPPRLWPARESSGAYGRVVRIGAFGTRQQAKLGWRKMQRAYPAVGRLPAVVVTDRNSRGRVFYRFQIGTTSQAHSEVLCQRMHRIRFSCAVVGLPWKAKIER